MKKLFLILIILAVSLLPIRAFAEEPVFNKYGVRPFHQDEVLSNPNYGHHGSENLNKIKSYRNNEHFTGEYDLRLNFGAWLCGDYISSHYSDSDIQRIQKGCEAWRDGKYKSFLSYKYSDSNPEYKLAHFLVYTGTEQLKVKYSEHFEVFSLQIPESDYRSEDFIHFYIENHLVDCSYIECNFNTSQISVTVNSGDNAPEIVASDYRAGLRLFFSFGSYTSYRFISVWNEFDIEFPDDFPESDKPARSRDVLQNSKPKQDFYPRPSFSVKDKRLDAMILNLDSENQQALNVTHTRPSFSIYDEKKEREIFTYHGSNLADRFIYDFEEHGKYYLKTIVSQPPPMVLGEGKYKVHQPVWTEILIDGGSYAFFPNGDNSATCDDATCSLPDYARSCVGRFEEISGSVGCEFRKLNDFLKSKLGFLWAPVDILTRTASNFHRANAVSCSVGQGPLTINACPISEKFPQLYAFLNMASNGVLLFGFVIFLRNQLSGFVSERGGE